MVNSLKKIVSTVQKLAQMDPQDAAIDATAQELKDEAALASSAASETESDRVKGQLETDVALLNAQIDKLHSAAAAPARNYARIQSICAGLKRAAIIAQRPQYASVRPKLAELTAKVAGIFSEVDTVEDLNKPLEQIEKAVHSLYGDQSKNSTFYFERRNKGHHGKE